MWPKCKQVHFLLWFKCSFSLEGFCWGWVFFWFCVFFHMLNYKSGFYYYILYWHSYIYLLNFKGRFWYVLGS